MDIISTILTSQDSLIRIALVILIAVYIFFALILTFQIRNLNRIINQVTFSPIFSALAFTYLAATIGLLFFAVLSL